MEKLIELLNEAQKDVGLFWHCLGNCERKLYAKGCWELTKELDDDYDTYYYSDEDICSKRCGFIKWLVENDKINWREASQKVEDLGSAYGWFAMYDGIDIDCLIMLLSISDNPIQDLCNLLN